MDQEQQQMPKELVKELEDAFKPPKRGRILSVKRTESGKDDMEIIYEHGSSQKKEIISFQKEEIIIAGNCIGLLKFKQKKRGGGGGKRKKKKKDMNPIDEYYLGMECIHPIVGGNDGWAGETRYFTTINKGSGIFLPFSKFKCKLSKIDILCYFFRSYLSSISIFDKFRNNFSFFLESTYTLVFFFSCAHPTHTFTNKTMYNITIT
ncbi:hypothetical protein RFI_12342 [Reticulomyxa filosa]|uniref:CAP-Gly domain-containing protein n=1 Tax=Reticulomyxa filosa TaxID=46433 RepID=X6NGC6_RETFI|nr:hypothetical protein RFI_12342 [Reticulomyxa filosa]|eukprot:ETO24814.1 hypothetical protein RFI_12342 [Reticulomyxa filosa]